MYKYINLCMYILNKNIAGKLSEHLGFKKALIVTTIGVYLGMPLLLNHT